MVEYTVAWLNCKIFSIEYSRCYGYDHTYWLIDKEFSEHFMMQ